MNVLVLDPGAEFLDFSLFCGHQRIPHECGRIGCPGGDFAGALETLFQNAIQPELIGARAVFGGDDFSAPAVADESVMRRLEALEQQAPLHLPRIIQLLRELQRLSPGTPAVIDFETAFFVGLPQRESLYAIDPSLAARLRLRRYGYHGIFHRAACREAARLHERMGRAGGLRVLSICLEPKPEVAGAIGGAPVYVTGGASPLEGLPGRTSCGDVDPSLPGLLLRRGFGPESIDELLSWQSGLCALAGRQTELDEVLADDRPELAFARQHFLYRLLQACGAGAAAMGGVDQVMLSGRYARAAQVIAEWVSSDFACRCLRGRRDVGAAILSDGLHRIVADDISAAFLQERAAPACAKTEPAAASRPIYNLIK